MCQSNSTTSVCGKDVQTYFDRQKAGKKPAITFCDQTRGIVLCHILNHLSDASTLEYSTGSTPGVAEELIKDESEYWPLVSACNLNFGKRDKTGAYTKFVYPSFRDLVKYVQRKAVQWGAIVNMPAGWGPGKTFQSAEQAGDWFRCRLNEAPSVPSTPTKPKDPRPWTPRTPASRLSSSRWAADKGDFDVEASFGKLSLDRKDTEAISVSGPSRWPSAPGRRADEPAPRSARPEATGYRSIEQWSDGVRSDVSRPGLGQAEAARRLERIGRQRFAMLDKAMEWDREEREVWAALPWSGRERF